MPTHKPLPTVRTAILRLTSHLKAGSPCPLCEAPSFFRPGTPAGITAPKRYRADPAEHARWHFRESQLDSVIWWGVAALSGLALLAGPQSATSVYQADEPESLFNGDRLLAYRETEKFIRENWHAIADSGHRVFYKQAPYRLGGRLSDGYTEFWFVDPAFLLLAFEIAKGYATPDDGMRDREFHETMLAMLREQRETADGERAAKPTRAAS